MSPRRQPPHNLTAEEHVLGACLVSPAALGDVVAADLRPDHLYKPAHRHVFEAMLRLLRTGQPVDTTTVSDELRRDGFLDQVGGLDHLHALQNTTPTISNAAHHAGIVQRTAVLRQVIATAADITESAYGEPDDPGTVLTEGIAKLSKLAGTSTGHTGGLDLIDWTAAETERSELLDGYLFEGRWSSGFAAAKTGKSTWGIYIGVHLSEGIHPYDRTAIAPVNVVHIDAELGRFDLGAVVRACGYDPAELGRWHATDLPPKLNTPKARPGRWPPPAAVDAHLIIVDGINGTVDGPEKDDMTWRPFYDLFVAPAKAERRAVLTLDNTGHDEKGRPRGSSVKIDKPDAVIWLRRTDDGLRLTTTYRRSAEFTERLDLAATGFDGGTVKYAQTGATWLEGTRAAADLLNDLGVPTEAGRPAARSALTDATRKPSPWGTLRLTGTSCETRSSRLRSGGGRRTSDGPADCPGTDSGVSLRYTPNCPHVRGSRCPRNCPPRSNPTFGLAIRQLSPTPFHAVPATVPDPWRP